jgi:hypothetical protein
MWSKADGAWRLAVRVLAPLAFVLWFSGMYAFFSFLATRPELPDPGSGRVYQLNNHGDIAYVTLSEIGPVHGLLAAGGACMLAAILIGRRKAK